MRLYFLNYMKNKNIFTLWNASDEIMQKKDYLLDLITREKKDRINIMFASNIRAIK